MSATFDRVRKLVESGDVRISEHGYDEMHNENILARDVIAGVFNGVVVEDYPAYAKGPCVLVLQSDQDGAPLHIVWGIPKDRVRRRSLSRLTDPILNFGRMTS